jgi:hypothetical protein
MRAPHWVWKHCRQRALTSHLQPVCGIFGDNNLIRNLIPVFENPLQHSSTHNANSLQHGQLDFDLGLSKPPVTMFPSSDGRMSFKHVGKRFKKQTFANIFGIIFLCGWVVLSSRVGDAGNKRLLG